jgi:hypothetical protein
MSQKKQVCAKDLGGLLRGQANEHRAKIVSRYFTQTAKIKIVSNITHDNFSLDVYIDSATLLLLAPFPCCYASLTHI